MTDVCVSAPVCVCVVLLHGEGGMGKKGLSRRRGSESSEETRFFWCSKIQSAVSIGTWFISVCLLVPQPCREFGLGYIPPELYTRHGVSGKVGQLNSYGEGMRDRSGGSSQDSFQGTGRTMCVSGAAVEMAREASWSRSICSTNPSQRWAPPSVRATKEHV